MYTKIYINAYRHTEFVKDCPYIFYVRLTYIQYKHTYFVYVCVHSLVYKSLHSVEQDFLGKSQILHFAPVSPARGDKTERQRGLRRLMN